MKKEISAKAAEKKKPVKKPAAKKEFDIISRIVDLADSKKAENIVTLSVAKKSSIADHFIICEGSSDRQVSAIADEIVDELKKEGVEPIRMDGKGPDGWIVLDFGDVLVHVFRTAERQLFRLEELWGKKRSDTEGMEHTEDRAPAPVRTTTQYGKSFRKQP